MLTADNVKITWVKSTIGSVQKQRATVKALGLKRLNHSVIRQVSPELKGMIDKVKHLVSVEYLPENDTEAKKE